MRIRPVLFSLLVACQSATVEKPDTVAQRDPIATPTENEAGAGKAKQARVVSVPLPQFGASSQQMQLPIEQIPAPWSLTASDGSGLRATRIDAKAVVQGPLAFTELHLYFENTENRIREGTFAITLPSGAAVSRFAMEMENGRLMEAEVVEKQLARRAYEDFLHRKQDPALMEKAEGNQFTARVFPIPAKGVKHLVISFSQELPGERYVLPLRGLPKVDRIDASLDVMDANGARTTQKLAQANWQPDRDFVSTAPAAAEAIAAGRFVVAQLSPFDQATVAKDTPTAVTLLVDTSASRALGFARYAERVRELVAQMALKYPGVNVDVVAFDQDQQSIYSGPATGFASSHVQALITRGAAGASNIAQAINSIAAKQRVVIVTDGVVTAGVEGAELKAAVKALGAKQVERVDVVMSGGIRDEALAESLVTAGLVRTGAVMDLDVNVADVAMGIGERVMSDIAVSVEGAEWVYPTVIKSARPMQRTMVYAKLKKPSPTMTVKIGNMRREVGNVNGTPAMIERAAAAAEIADLDVQLEAATTPEAKKALKKSIADKSVAARVISSQTSLLVLESDSDYARFGIDRNALADILVVGPNGIEQTRRASQIATTKTVPVRPTKTEEKPAHKKSGELAVRKPGPSADESDEPMKEAKQKRAQRDEDDGEMDMKIAGKDAEEAPMRGAMGSGASSPGGGAVAMDSPSPAPAAPPPPPRPEPRVERPSSVTSSVRRFESVDSGALSQSEAEPVAQREAWPPPGSPAPLRGQLAQIDRKVKSGKLADALSQAKTWHEEQPGDVLALIGYGEALEANKDIARAARIYGSIIDLFPARADLRRFAGERLERIGASARDLAVDTYKRAVEERPDHLTGHRLLAYAQLRAGHHAEAFAAIIAGLTQNYPSGRFEGGERILREDAGLIGAAYLAAHPAMKKEIVAALAKVSSRLPSGPSTRFIMYWETDANDVDFHIQDAQGGHAFYSNKQLPSGGELYADITTGYGPECFAIQGTPKAGPYKLSINYYSQGPMGYGMGLLQIIKHDGKGGLAFQDRPYVIMNDHAYVNLGTFK